jgi:hypothetical protein
MILFAERLLNRALNEYVVHFKYHTERTHQGLGNRLFDPAHAGGSPAASIPHRERLGGVLNFYYLPQRDR